MEAGSEDNDTPEEFHNPIVNKILKDLDPFEYNDKIPMGREVMRRWMQFTTLENGAKYEGEWNPMTDV